MEEEMNEREATSTKNYCCDALKKRRKVKEQVKW